MNADFWCWPSPQSCLSVSLSHMCCFYLASSVSEISSRLSDRSISDIFSTSSDSAISLALSSTSLTISDPAMSSSDSAPASTGSVIQICSLILRCISSRYDSIGCRSVYISSSLVMIVSKWGQLVIIVSVTASVSRQCWLAERRTECIQRIYS